MVFPGTPYKLFPQRRNIIPPDGGFTSSSNNIMSFVTDSTKKKTASQKLLRNIRDRSSITGRGASIWKRGSEVLPVQKGAGGLDKVLAILKGGGGGRGGHIKFLV